MSSQEMLIKYPAGHASALIAIVFFAALSLAAIIFVLLRFSWFSSRAIFFKRSAPSDDAVQERRFFQTQLGAYTAALLFSNFLGSIAFMLNIHWIDVDGVMRDSLCMSQGILSQVSDIANAYFTGTIAIHSFNTLVLRNRLPVWICFGIIASGWLLSIIIGVLPSVVSGGSSGPMYGWNGLSCGISEVYTTAQVVLRLVPICLAALVTGVFYIVIYLILRGSLVINDGVKFNLDQEARKSVVVASGDSLEYRRFIGTVVRSMMWYPVAYIGLLLWSVIVLLVQVTGGHLPFAFTVFSATCAAMLGLANALIILNTLGILSPMLRGPSPAKPRGDLESAYTGVKSLASVKTYGSSRNATSTEKSLPPVPPFDATGPTSAKLPPSPPSKEAFRGKHTPSNSRTPLLPPHDITSVSELEAAHTLPEITEKDLHVSPSDLSTAPRHERSPVVRENTMSSVESPVNDVPLTAVDLGTVASDIYDSPTTRDSFISLYASPSPTLPDRLPLPTPWRSGTARPSVASVNSDVTRSPAFASPRLSRDMPMSPVTANAADVPGSSFVERIMRQRTYDDAAALQPTSGGVLSPPSWAALVTSAATDRRTGGSPLPSPQLRASRRHSRMLDELPPALRPRTPALPASPGLGSGFLDGARASPLSVAFAVREGPARTAVPGGERATLRTTTTTPRQYGFL